MPNIPKATTPPRRRESVKNQTVMRDLRAQITGGTLLPGGRLPTRFELEQHYGASRLTVQRALDQLVRDGFVYVQGRQATYVSKTPPHLHRVALAFPKHTHQTDEWKGFWTALSRAARELEAESADEGGALQIPFYYGVDGHADAEDYGRLAREIEGKRLAGVIFPDEPLALQSSPLVAPDVARVALMGGGEVAGVAANVATVTLNNASLIDKSLEFLRARGRRKVAVLADPRWLDMHGETLWRSLDKHGLESHPYWMQGVPTLARQAASNCAHLLAHSRAVEPFDGLFVADDNLVEPALAGLLASGTRVPGDVEIVTHANFPSPHPSFVPLQRVGFSAHEVLRACLKSLEWQASNGDGGAAPNIVVDARLEA